MINEYDTEITHTGLNCFGLDNKYWISEISISIRFFKIKLYFFYHKLIFSLFYIKVLQFLY